MFELYQAFSCRSVNYPLSRVGFFKNKWLILSVLVSLLAVISVVYIPALQNVFDTTALSIYEFLLLILMSGAGALYLEINKFVKMKIANVTV